LQPSKITSENAKAAKAANISKARYMKQPTARYATVYQLSSYTRERADRTKADLRTDPPTCPKCSKRFVIIHLDNDGRRCSCVKCGEKWDWPEVSQ